MNTLDKLIKHLQQSVANEAIDYDQLQTEILEQPVDPTVVEAVQEQTGLTVPTIYEILNNKEAFNPYQNVTGKSGIQSYKYGPDWVLVYFGRETYYLYTLKSVPDVVLANLKFLADSGQGLNAYLNKMVGPAYAAKEVKQVVSVRPGMESYSISGKGYKSGLVGLLIAFRNGVNNMTVVSNEGFFDSVKKALGMSNKGDLPKIYGIATSVRRLQQDIKRNFGDPNWLKKQNFVTGPIDNKGISSVLVLNGKVDIFNAIKATEPFALAAKQNIEEIRNYQIKTKPAMDLLIKNNKNLTSEVYDQVLKLVKPISENFNSKVKWPTKLITGEGTYPSEKAVSAKYAENDIKIEALSEADVEKAIGMLIQSLDTINKADFSIPDLPDNLDKLFYDPQRAPKDVGGLSWEKWHHLLFLCIAPGSKSLEASMAATRAEHSYIATIVGCARWIDRSIKGKVSVEDYTSKRYQQHIKEAGPDGLRPDALKMLAIGLECFTSKNVSVEGFMVSNEGIWDSLKSMFSKKEQSNKGGKKEAKPIEKPINTLDEARRLIEGPSENYGAVTMSKHYAHWFAVDNKPVTDVVVALRSDIQEYKKQFQLAKGPFKAIYDFSAKYRQQMERFEGDDDRPEEFAKLLKDMIAKKPPEYLSKFNCNKSFMGYDKDAWLDDDGKFDVDTYPTNNITSVNLPAIDATKVKELKKLLSEMLTLGDEVSDLEDGAHNCGFDYSDPPIRGYIEDDTCDKLLGEANLDVNHITEVTTGVINGIYFRVWALFDAIVHYMVAAEKAK